MELLTYQDAREYPYYDLDGKRVTPSMTHEAIQTILKTYTGCVKHIYRITPNHANFGTTVSILYALMRPSVGLDSHSLILYHGHWTSYNVIKKMFGSVPVINIHNTDITRPTFADEMKELMEIFHVSATKPMFEEDGVMWIRNVILVCDTRYREVSKASRVSILNHDVDVLDTLSTILTLVDVIKPDKSVINFKCPYFECLSSIHAEDFDASIPFSSAMYANYKRSILKFIPIAEIIFQAYTYSTTTTIICNTKNINVKTALRPFDHKEYECKLNYYIRIYICIRIPSCSPIPWADDSMGSIIAYRQLAEIADVMTIKGIPTTPAQIYCLVRELTRIY